MQDWKTNIGYNTADDYLEGTKRYSVSIGSQYTTPTMDADLTVIQSSVTTAIKTATWNAIYAADDAAFDKIISDARAELISLGYDKVVEFDKANAELRKQKENEALAADKG
jgi:hypothetical protein